MDKATAALLLGNLLDRVEQDAVTGKWRLGTLTSKEKAAIELAVKVLGAGNAVSTVTVPPPPDKLPPEVTTLPEPAIALDIRSLERTSADNPGITLCLDFGTAMSKAFCNAGGRQAH